MFAPPAGYEDILDDAEQSDNVGHFHRLEVDDVGVFRARKPMPRSVAVLGNAVSAKIDDRARGDYIGLFLQNHLTSKSLDRLMLGMMTGKYPADAAAKVCKAISTWGTARPTRPSSTCR